MAAEGETWRCHFFYLSIAVAEFGALKVVGVIDWKVKGLELMTTEPLFASIFILGGIS